MMEEKEEVRKVVEALARAKIPHAEAKRRWWHSMRQLSVIVAELDKTYLPSRALQKSTTERELGQE